jgi:hypothetical protein
MALWKWIIGILLVLLLLYLAYMYFPRGVEEGFASSPSAPKSANDLADLTRILPNSGNLENDAGNRVNPRTCGDTSEISSTTSNYMYIFDPTGAWVQANIALLEYPFVKREVAKDIESKCQGAALSSGISATEITNAVAKL